jgi:hypothetical protein
MITKTAARMLDRVVETEDARKMVAVGAESVFTFVRWIIAALSNYTCIASHPHGPSQDPDPLLARLRS